MQNAIFDEQEQDLQGQDFLSEDSVEAHDFLADFYKEMNAELEAQPNRRAESSPELATGSSGRSTTASKATVALPAFDFSQDTGDLIRFIDHNERRHQQEALRYLKQHSFIETHSAGKTDFKQHVLTAEEPLLDVNQNMVSVFNFSLSKPTAVTITEDLILVGTSSGEVWMYDVETQQKFCSFLEKSREFHDNPVRALAAHPVKNDYVLVGYNGGQIVLLDVTEQTGDHSKAIKVIKDHHKGVPVTNLSFCDLVSGSHYFQ